MHASIFVMRFTRAPTLTCNSASVCQVDATTSTFLEMQDGRHKELRESQENLLTLLKHQRRMVITAFFIVRLPVAAPPAVVQAADVADNAGEEQPNVEEEEDNIVNDDAWRDEG